MTGTGETAPHHATMKPPSMCPMDFRESRIEPTLGVSDVSFASVKLLREPAPDLLRHPATASCLKRYSFKVTG